MYIHDPPPLNLDQLSPKLAHAIFSMRGRIPPKNKEKFELWSFIGTLVDICLNFHSQIHAPRYRELFLLVELNWFITAKRQAGVPQGATLSPPQLLLTWCRLPSRRPCRAHRPGTACSPYPWRPAGSPGTRCCRHTRRQRAADDRQRAPRMAMMPTIIPFLSISVFFSPSWSFTQK